MKDKYKHPNKSVHHRSFCMLLENHAQKKYKVIPFQPPNIRTCTKQAEAQNEQENSSQLRTKEALDRSWTVYWKCSRTQLMLSFECHLCQGRASVTPFKKIFRKHHLQFRFLAGIGSFQKGIAELGNRNFGVNHGNLTIRDFSFHALKFHCVLCNMLLTFENF